MNLWRLEWLRLMRTRRVLALFGVWAFFGLLGPLTARYLAEILETLGGDIAIQLPAPVAADGITQFMSNGQQIGLLVVIVVSAGALTLDANAEMSMFLRTRVDSIGRLIAPRYVVATAASVAAFTVGLLLAVYETWALLGSLHASRIIGGGLLFMLYLAFVIAVVAALAGWFTSVVTTTAISVGVLLLLAVSGLIDSVGRWFPSHLAGSLDAVVRGAQVSEYLGAMLVTVVLIPALVGTGIKGLERREL
jgi:ABC-2 type transport system permease protein